MSEIIWYRVRGSTFSIAKPRQTNVYHRWLRDIAEACADDYHSEHDGWEASWPLELSLHETEDGPAIAVYEVSREAVPEFSAVRLTGLPEEAK